MRNCPFVSLKITQCYAVVLQKQVETECRSVAVTGSRLQDDDSTHLRDRDISLCHQV